MLVVKDVFAVDFVLLVVLDMVVREGSLIIFVLRFLCLLFVSCDANFVIVMNSTPAATMHHRCRHSRMQY